MAAELVADLGLFKTLYESAKALKGMNDPAVRNAAIIEIQEEILAARESQTMLLERVSSLEKEVVDLKHWDAEKKRYKLTDFGGGTFAYLLSSEAANEEPPHRICAQCYQRRKKSILQFLHRTYGQDYYKCYKCYKCGDQAFGVYIAPNLDFYADEADNSASMMSH